MAESVSPVRKATPKPKQLLVFGRGIERASSPYAGTVRRDSAESGASYERAARAVEYTFEHEGEVELVIFSGGISFSLRKRDRPTMGSEGWAMQQAAEGLNLQAPWKIDAEARSTYGNFIHSLPWLDSHGTIGAVTHANQWDHIKEVGGFVLPHATLVPIIADADPRRASYAPSLNDRVSTLLYSAAMRNILPGDPGLPERYAAIERRDELTQKLARPLVVAAGVMLEAVHSRLHSVESPTV